MASVGRGLLLDQLEESVRGLAPEDRLALVERLTRSAPSTAPLDPHEERQRLAEAYASYSSPHNFEPGQLVGWKPFLRNRDLPEYDQPAIVLDVLKEPLIDTTEPTGSPYYRERLDLVLGVLDGDSDLAALHVDGSRFEPVPD
jgi:hypothetical protein